LSTEFAKEAMACQKLDYDEILSIRWAHDDPNPVAKDSIERADKDAMFALLQAKGISLKPAEFEYPAEYQLPDAKRLRVEDGGDIAAQYPQIAYPDTDIQYQDTPAITFDPTAFTTTVNNKAASNQSTSLLAAADQTVAQAQQNALSRLGLLIDYADEPEEQQVVTEEEVPAATKTEAAEQEEAEGGDDEEEEEEDVGSGGWCQYIDETSGLPYYFNSSTGESSWTAPTFDDGTAPAETSSAEEDGDAN